MGKDEKPSELALECSTVQYQKLCIPKELYLEMAFSRSKAF